MGNLPDPISPEIFASCLTRLETAGIVRRLSIGDYVLLQPELLDAYLGWVILAGRAEPDGLGYIPKASVLSGAFAMDEDRRLVDRNLEKVVLLSAIEEAVRRGIAILQPTDKGEMLVFPSEVRSDFPDYPVKFHPAISYRFEGPVRAIYATLAVCLINSRAFGSPTLYRDALTVTTVRHQVCGFSVRYEQAGLDSLASLTAFFGDETGTDSQLLFLRYVDSQLNALSFPGSLTRERIYQCVSCGNVIAQRDIAWRKSHGRKDVICRCDARLKLDDLAEEATGFDDRIGAIQSSADHESARQARVSTLAQREAAGDFDVILFHNSADKPAVRELAQALRSEGVAPWLDEERILPGVPVVRELEAAISNSRAAAVIVGPGFLGKWESYEYYAFLQRAVNSTSQPLLLIPVLLEGADEEILLPPFLRTFAWVDLRERGDKGLEIARFAKSILSSRTD